MPQNPHQQGTLLSIPSLPFTESVELQEALAAQRNEGSQLNILILTEHEPVLTLGRTAKPEHWELHLAELKSQGINVYQTNRGGSVTYHGPGQIIGYPILKLRDFCRGPKVYVQNLEEVLIRTLGDWGIAGCRHELFRGVWVNTEKGHLEKIASIGVRISKGITMHGFALNVNMDLRPFSLLSPCGIKNCAITSMAKHLDQHVDVSRVKARLAAHFSHIFRLEWIERNMTLTHDS